MFDNPALLQVNPEYLAWLLSLPLLERERLLGGNWKIRPAAGLYFKREWCAVVDEVPADLDVVRYWDLAATEKTEFNDPDWTVGIKLGRDKNGGYWLLDMVRGRANPGDVDRLLLNTADAGRQTGPHRVRQGSGAGRQEPGASPGARAQWLHRTRRRPESGDKLTRFGPFSSQCRAGNVKIRRGSWNEELFRVLEGFPDLAHDDEVDACSGALEMLNPQMKSWGIYEFYSPEGRAAAGRAARQTATHPNPTGPWLHGMARRAEQIELNRGSCTEVDTHDVLGRLRMRGGTTELTLAGGPRVRIHLPPRGESRANLGRHRHSMPGERSDCQEHLRKIR